MLHHVQPQQQKGTDVVHWVLNGKSDGNTPALMDSRHGLCASAYTVVAMQAQQSLLQTVLQAVVRLHDIQLHHGRAKTRHTRGTF